MAFGRALAAAEKTVEHSTMSEAVQAHITRRRQSTLPWDLLFQKTRPGSYTSGSTTISPFLLPRRTNDAFARASTGRPAPAKTTASIHLTRPVKRCPLQRLDGGMMPSPEPSPPPAPAPNLTLRELLKHLFPATHPSRIRGGPD